MKVEMTCVAEMYAHPDFKELTDGYAEYRIKKLPRPQYRQEDYEALERSGIHAVFRAMDGLKMIGFLSMLDAKIPHYGLTVSIVESLYVLPSYRHTGAGLRLIRKAEQFARFRMNSGIFINCPYGAELAQVLPKLDYSPETVTYFKAFTC